ncbi:aldehyde dehydrogenase family 3 member H1-like isoform X2 [Cicer arietinum]|uniref:Aldehyde dehydrogenase family 3 member H1-like isoform X2 n=1 Tax=Cicer arietinum TaxID=3827 RepID=A0A1S3DX46_CICAR|nr:aldehyde dehydrogenase family 3 member H1-like isoform X2 [Cicer arietinum]
MVSELWNTRPQVATTGTCCLVGVIFQQTLFIANVGDYCVGGVAAIQLSPEHNANLEGVRQELRELHPYDPQIVVLKHGVWRVKGIIQVNKLEESFNVINSRTRPLAAYLFTKDNKFKEQFVKKVSAGGLLINDTSLHLVVYTLPFGGVGDSGMGAYHGKFSFHAFTHRKAVLYRGFTGDSSLRYPPYTDRKQKCMKALVAGDVPDVQFWL